MLYLLHESADIDTVKADLVPFLVGQDFELVEFPYKSNFEPGDDAVLLLYLPDKILRELIPEAARKDWPLGILPHPENKFTSKGLGITGDAEELISEMIGNEEEHQLDLLFCNDTPVFQTVNIGDIFILTEKNAQRNFFNEIVQIIRNIKKASSLSHNPYELSSDDEKMLTTSALGIVVVEHASSSLISKRLVPDTSITDGNFHAFIIAPQNLLVLLWFFLRSLWPKKKNMGRLPSFIGSIKTSNLKIKDSEPIEHIIDGEKYTAKELFLEVHQKEILLKHKTTYSEKTGDENGKKSIKIGGLPTGQTRKELMKRSLPIMPRASAEQFEDLFTVLRENAKTSWAFMVMMVLSTLIASFGLFGNSSPVIIGAMILAPIISPIVSFAMGMVRYDVSMLKTGFTTITAGTLVSLAFAAAVSIIIPLKIITPEIEARLSPTLLDMGIAIASGIAAAYAHAKEGIAKSLAGVAIAVALVPPLAVAGIGIGWWNWEVFSGAILLYATNLAGIIMFAGLTFLILGFAPFKRAKMGLIYTFLIILLVTFPLSLSFNRIMQEATITRALEGTTIENTVLRDVRIRFGSPVVVSLRLVGPEAMEPDKIHAIKEKIEERIEQPVRLEVVSAIEF